MPDPSLPSARQLALISCGGSTKEGCGAKFHAAYVTPTLDPSGNASGNDRGQDAAMIPLLTGFVVNGLGVDYLRHLTNQPSASFYHTKATCYGMSENAPNATSTVGQLTKFDFTILAFPPPDPTRPASGPSVPELFSVVRGGGETPTLGQYVNGVLQAIPVKGDSGGPCIVHTSGVDGDVIGILHGGPPKFIGSIYEPSSADYSAAQGFRDFAQSVLGVHGPRVIADLDGGGVADDAIEMRPGFQSGGHLGWGVGGTSNGMIVVGSSFYNWIDPNGVKPTVLQTGWAALVRVDDTSSINIFNQTAIDEPTLLMGAMDARQDAFLGQVIAQPRPAFVAQKDAPPRYSGELSLYSGVGFLPLACPSGDTTAPSITAIQATPSCIWPPNDKLVLYQLDNQIQVTIKDACDPFPKVRIVNVTSSQLDADQPDVFFGNRAACVRAERSDAPRIYTVTVEAKDFSGNTSFATTTVTVPQAKTRGCKLDSSSFVLDGDPRCSL